ncbi:hypothetical protein ALC57_06597 [Trachymyrmex cornetzi]|uniref:Uncharacterized protein n=1 Tax=Trachymyrmex cornetzi TaxID=471704 RepID=A0A151J886_9HYME|nr:hypothetical protein ALC57_06597 [Trachymyrmex cornetzi]
MPKRMARWLLSDMKILELPSSSSHPTVDVSCNFPSSSIDHPSLVFARRFSYRRPWRKLMHGDRIASLGIYQNSFSNQCRSICSSQRSLDSDGISGELVSAKVGGNFTAAAVLRQRAQPAGLSIQLSESCFETRLILDGRSVSSSNTIDVDVDVSVGVGFGFGVSLRLLHSTAWHGPLKAQQINVAHVTTPRIYERLMGNTARFETSQQGET